MESYPFVLAFKEGELVYMEDTGGTMEVSSGDTILTFEDSEYWTVEDTTGEVSWYPEDSKLILRGNDKDVELSTDGTNLFFNGHQLVTVNSLPKMEVKMLDLLGSASFWIATVIVVTVWNKLIAPRLSIKYLVRKFYHLIFKPARKVSEKAKATAYEAKREFKKEGWKDVG